MAVHVRIVISHCMRLLYFEKVEVLLSSCLGQLPFHRYLILALLGVEKHHVFLNLLTFQLLFASYVFACSVLQLSHEIWLSRRIFRRLS